MEKRDRPESSGFWFWAAAVIGGLTAVPLAVGAIEANRASTNALNNGWIKAAFVMAAIALIALAVSGVLSFFRWREHRTASPEQIHPVAIPPDPEPPPGRRTGILNRPGGVVKVRDTKFGSNLDVGIDNRGELDERGSKHD